MNLEPNNPKCRTSRPQRTLTVLAATLALGASLALPTRADNLNPPTTTGGIRVSPVIVGTPVVNGSNATIQIEGLQAPYMIQVSSNGVDWMNGGVTSLKHPNFSGACTATNVPSGTALFRLMMLGATNWAGKYNSGALGISNVFVGSTKCIGCHSDKVSEWSGTGHAKAITELINTNTGAFLPFRNDSCIPCHTVGKNQPGGYVDWATTPQLANVQCENCHGSANSHVNISGRTYHPVNSLSAATCGACHTESHHPTFEEWESSGHAEVTPDVSYGVGEGAGTIYEDTVTAVLTNATTGLTYTAVLNGYIVLTNGITNALGGMVNSTNDFNGLSRQMTCGFCHSGATRVAMLYDYEARQKGITNFLALPDKWEAAETAVTCAVCHDPHSDARDAQLRNPLNSTNYYTMFTGSSIAVTNRYTNVLGQTSMTVSYKADGFASQYNPEIHICAQCHNSRGARWDGKSKSWNVASNAMVLGSSQSFSRGPHHSPQYNLLIGIVQDDYLNLDAQGASMNYSASHAGIQNRTPYNTNQCATCHVVSYAVNSTTNVTGHTFALATNNCTLCHGSVPNYEEQRTTISNRIVGVVALLNKWATNNGPAIFGTNYSNYLQNGWEYTTISSLATVTNAGPSGSDAAKVPDPIKQARFNLYMVNNDGSGGVHNPGFSSYLITDASNKVQTVLGASTNTAIWMASATKGYTPFNVSFTTGGSGISSYRWDFGDGGSSTAANPSHLYTARGSNTVSLTVVASGVTNTLTRTNYIGVYAQPTVAFAVSATLVHTNDTVTFTNLCSNTSDVTLYRWTVRTSPSVYVTNSSPTVSYTYTVVGTNNVTVRAVTPAGNTTAATQQIIVLP
ncbi:MAG: hypothetical protein RLY20_3299 [Verrucomicrobiota bacterium]|jgi:PKD repeat protein